jgi:predicted nucleic acid-binding protein
VRRVVADASAIAAIAFGEPEGAALAATLDGAAIFAPTLLAFELANTAWKKMRRHPGSGPALLQALEAALSQERGIRWQAVQPAEVVLVAETLGCTAYDAAYVWLAGTLGADLVTLDKQLIQLSASAVA